MDDAAYYRKKAEQCRRLAWSTGDQRAIDELHAMAREFDAKANDQQATDTTSGATPEVLRRDATKE